MYTFEYLHSPGPLTTSAAIKFVISSAIGIVVGISVTVTFVVSFSLGVLVAAILICLCYIPKISHKNMNLHPAPISEYEVVNTTRNLCAVEMKANTSYGAH